MAGEEVVVLRAVETTLKFEDLQLQHSPNFILAPAWTKPLASSTRPTVYHPTDAGMRPTHRPGAFPRCASNGSYRRPDSVREAYGAEQKFMA